MNEAGNLNSSMNMSREHKMMNGSRQASASKSNGNQNSDNSSSIGGRINGTGHTNGEDENELGDFLSQLRMSDDVVSGKRSDF